MVVIRGRAELGSNTFAVFMWECIARHGLPYRTVGSGKDQKTIIIQGCVASPSGQAIGFTGYMRGHNGAAALVSPCDFTLY